MQAVESAVPVHLHLMEADQSAKSWKPNTGARSAPEPPLGE